MVHLEHEKRKESKRENGCVGELSDARMLCANAHVNHGIGRNEKDFGCDERMWELGVFGAGLWFDRLVGVLGRFD